MHWNSDCILDFHKSVGVLIINRQYNTLTHTTAAVNLCLLRHVEIRGIINNIKSRSACHVNVS